MQCNETVYGAFAVIVQWADTMLDYVCPVRLLLRITLILPLLSKKITNLK